MRKFALLFFVVLLTACQDLNIVVQRKLMNDCIAVNTNRLQIAGTLDGLLDRIADETGTDEQGLIDRSLHVVESELSRIGDCSAQARDKDGNEFVTFVFINYWTQLSLIEGAYEFYDLSVGARGKEEAVRRIRELIVVLVAREEWGPPS